MHAAQRTDEKLVGPLFVEIAAGGVLVSLFDGLLDVVQVDAEAQHFFGIDEHLKLLPPAAGGEDLRDSGDGQQSLPDNPVGQGSHLQRVGLAPFAPHPDHEDLAHDRRNGRQLRLNARRHVVDDQRQPFGHDLTVVVDVGPPVEFDVDHRKPDP